MSEKNLNKAVFLDRDGTIIIDQHYPRDPEKVVALPGALEAMRSLKRMGYLLYIVSNQSGVGRGIISQDEFLAVSGKFESLLKEAELQVDGIAYCPHDPQKNCACRKPQIGMVTHMVKDTLMDWKNSYVVGDRISDLELGRNLGAHSVLVLTGHGKNEVDKVAHLKNIQIVESLTSWVKGLG